MKISLCFTPLRNILGVCDFLLSDKSNRSYIQHGPGPSKPYNGTKRVLAGSCFEYNSDWIRLKEESHIHLGCFEGE